jgi:hypothetical protein
MPSLQKIQKLQTQIEAQLLKNPLVNGIEIAALKKGNDYTDEMCLRILIADSKVTHKDLGLAKKMENIIIQLEHKKIEPM